MVISVRILIRNNFFGYNNIDGQILSLGTGVTLLLSWLLDKIRCVGNELNYLLLDCCRDVPDGNDFVPIGETIPGQIFAFVFFCSKLVELIKTIVVGLTVFYSSQPKASSYGCYFTQELCATLLRKNTLHKTAEEIFTSVRSSMEKKYGGTQVPCFSTTASKEFCFVTEIRSKQESMFMWHTRKYPISC